MKQVLLKRGDVLIADVPEPQVRSGNVLVQVTHSCISPGTELSVLESSQESLLKKATKHPEKVVKAFQMLRTEGLSKTVSTVQGQQQMAHAVGYSLAGEAIEIGEDISNVRVGDRIACVGAGIAHHAEIVSVPKNLVVKIPGSVSSKNASTAAIGSIALHGVRRAEVALGDHVVVFGLGIIGQLAAQLAKAAGARVIGVDIDDSRVETAERSGVEKVYNSSRVDLKKEIELETGGRGVDCVLFAASSSDPSVLSQAFSLIRRKGRLVMLGVYGNKVDRADLYRREIDFLISTSYGPGRYDDRYELDGEDYPYDYVRWTENRNIAEYLRLIDTGAINLDCLIGEEYSIDSASRAYEELESGKSLVSILSYPLKDKKSPPVLSEASSSSRETAMLSSDRPIRIGLIGAGAFAVGVHLPNLLGRSKEFALEIVASSRGHHGKEVADKFGGARSTSDYQQVIDDPNVDIVFVCTRHDTHGELVLKALEAGKNVFVEKPLCITTEELDRIQSFYQDDSEPKLFLGFNRRFSRYARVIKEQVLDRKTPLFMTYRMNAGFLPAEHWVHGAEGGGRIVGEACHIVDLFRYFSGSPVRSVAVSELSPENGALSSADNKTITLEYEDGSVGSVHYFSTGSSELPKETCEVHFDRKTLILDDYKKLTGFGVSVSEPSSSTSKKGHSEMLEAIHNSLCDGSLPISLEEIFETTLVTLNAK